MPKHPMRRIKTIAVACSIVLLFTSAGICNNLTISSENLTQTSHFSVEKAQNHQKSKDPALTPSPLKSFIIKLKGDSLAAYASDPLNPGSSDMRSSKSNQLDVHSPISRKVLDRIKIQQNKFIIAAKSRLPGLLVSHRYDVIFNGISVVINANQENKLRTLPGIDIVYEDKHVHPHTDVSPYFIGADTLWETFGTSGAAGEGVVIGVIDTGVWPEHPSLRDPDPTGHQYPAPPKKWKGIDCNFGSTVEGDLPFTCTNKLLGASRFMETYDTLIGTLPTEFLSARDDDGHGTHTSTTAGGNTNVPSDLMGYPYNKISGVAPRAHLAVYKCLGELGGFHSDLIAGIQQAVADGVDVINYSISGGESPYDEATELAFLEAYAAGVFVAASAGNSGPEPDSVSHRGPWVTTVGASTTDRFFLSTVVLTAQSGETLQLTGSTITDGINTPTPVTLPPAGEERCNDPFAQDALDGKICLCAQGGGVGRAQKSWNVKQGGAVGMILYNQHGIGTDNNHIPSVHLDAAEGEKLMDFMDRNTDVTATFERGEPRNVKGDIITNFSSRGGPRQELEISKPDLTAPGINILAGNSPKPATPGSGAPGNFFGCLQGTSMSSPHVAGAAALLKSRHPHWSPGKIKSALMTTAKRHNIFKEDGETPANAFDTGSGRVDLARAADPGLTFDVDALDFMAFSTNLRHVNYPSIFLPTTQGKTIITRTPASVLPHTRRWWLSVEGPADLEIQVPKSLRLKPGQEKSFDLFIDASAVPEGETRQATLKMNSAGHTAQIPITIVRRPPEISLDVQCDPNQIKWGHNTDFTITVANNSYENSEIHLTDFLPWQLLVIPESVKGANAHVNSIEYLGTLTGAELPIVDARVQSGASPVGYLPLDFFGAQQVNASDESISNFTVPAFAFAGKTYEKIGVVSNGYIVLGGGDHSDVTYDNTDLPDAGTPNNTLVPFWTDLNPEAGGRVLIALLTDGVDTWIVVEWEQVPNFNDGNPNTFQAWIGINGVEDVSFTYGPEISDGNMGYLTIGAENANGLTGKAVYYNGTGTPPSPSAQGYEVDAYSIPGAPGETHTITFSAMGIFPGNWTNIVRATGTLFDGIETTYCSGKILWP